VKFRLLLSDRLLVRLDPRRAQTRGGLVIPETEAQSVRTGTIQQVGLGKRERIRRKNGEYREVLRPIEAKEGERIAFFIGSVDTRSGQSVSRYLLEDQCVIREDDVIGVLEGDVEVTQ